MGRRRKKHRVDNPGRRTARDREYRKIDEKKVKVCPDHSRPLRRSETRFGIRYDCEEPGCSVACWGGSTSTPADKETRLARSLAHAAFDPIWQNGAFTRTEAYRLLGRFLGLSKVETHIGYFDRATCGRVLEFVKQLTEERKSCG